MSWNPYLEEWAAANGSRVSGWICCSAVGTSPWESRGLSCWPDHQDNRHAIRDHLTRKYAFGVPGDDGLDCLARYAPLVEMGAGLGYWARCLRERGIDIVAYDAMGESWRAWFRPSILAECRRDGTRAIETRPHPERTDPVTWTEVLPGRPEILTQHPDRTLLLCWPDPWSGFAEAALGAYSGARIAIVGPNFAFLQDGEPRAPWRRIDEASVPQWHGSNDHLVVYERR